MSRLPLVLLALVLVPLAGCLKPVDTQSTEEPTTGPRIVTGTPATQTPSPSTASASTSATASASATATPAPRPPANATGNGTGNATGNATWRYDNRTGTVAGSGLPLVSATYEEVETVTVANGTLNLTLVLNATGDELDVLVQPPGCDDEDCGESLSVPDGRNATFAVDVPAAGNWTVTLSASGSGAVSCAYRLGIAQLVPGNGTGNATA